MKRVRLKRILGEKEFWLLVFLGILYFHRILFFGETVFFRDLSIHFIPQRQLLIDYINAGELPLWDPYLQGGQPYLQHMSNSAFYPSNLLYFFLPLLRAFNLDVALHVICSLIFTYLFSRVIGLQPISSFIVSLVYGFCGYTLSLINVLNLLWAFSHLPLLFLCWHLFLLENNRKWFAMAVIIGTIQVFASAPEVSTISLLSLLGWSLSYSYPCRSLFRKSIWWILLGVFIIGIASIQMIPAIEMISYSSRGHGLPYEVFAAWSISPKRLLEIFFPKFLGYIDVLPQEVYYWGSKLEDSGSPLIISIYFGCAVVALAVYGKGNRNNDRILPFRVRIFLASLFTLALLLSLGRSLPFFHFLFQYVPLITLFRYPVKFLIAGIFPLALLAGYSSELHFGDSSSECRISNSERFPSLKFLGILWSILVIVLFLLIVFLFPNNLANRIQEFFFEQPANDIIFYGLRSSFAHTTGIWLLIVLLYQYRRVKKRPWQHWILACIIMLDLLPSGRRVPLHAPEKFLTNIPPIVPIVHNEIGDGRLFRAEHSEEVLIQVLPDNIFQVPQNDIMWKTRWNLEVLNFYHAALYRIPGIFHADVVKLAPEPLLKLQTLIKSLPWEQRLPLLSAGGVTLILTQDDISIPGIHRIADIPNRSNMPFYLYRNESAAAREEFVTTWRFFTSDTEALGAMLTPTYDPRKHVALQIPKTTLFDWHTKTLKLPTVNSNFSECDGPLQIKKMRSNTHSALFSVSNSCDGYLVFSEPFYPGWRVYVDGKPTPIFRANYAFSAIFLPAGEHEVNRFYRPNSLLVGVLSSVVFCIILWRLLYRYKGLQKI